MSSSQDAGNAAAMREALIRARDAMVAVVESIGGEENDKVLKDIEAALAKPPRQCDMGTPEEQLRRYCKFTDRYNPCSYKGYVRCAEDCPMHIKLKREGYGELLCQLEWSQMPYTESDVNDGGK